MEGRAGVENRKSTEYYRLPLLGLRAPLWFFAPFTFWHLLLVGRKRRVRPEDDSICGRRKGKKIHTTLAVEVECSGKRMEGSCSVSQGSHRQIPYSVWEKSQNDLSESKQIRWEQEMSQWSHRFEQFCQSGNRENRNYNSRWLRANS